MNTKYAIIVGIEHYINKSLNDVALAENDVQAISGALENLGYEKQNQIVLINEQATKTSIETNYKNRLGSLVSGDEFIFYYAGHGFSEKLRNYLTAADSDPFHLPETSVSLQGLCECIKTSKSKKAIVFLDACETGQDFAKDSRSITDALCDDELQSFFNDSEYCVCFSACKRSQKSWSFKRIEHGVFTYHILKALSGDAPDALKREKFITSESLQNYLSASVQQTVNKYAESPTMQTPTCYGSLTREFIVADLTDIFEERAQERTINIQGFKSLSFIGEETIPIRSLSGFKNTHHVPHDINSHTICFVERCASDDVKNRIESLYVALKTKLGYRRRDMEKDDSTISTSDFRVNIFAEQQEEDPTLAAIITQLEGISSKELLESKEFSEVFRSRIDYLQVRLLSPLRMDQVIDELEDRELSVDYDSDANWCAVTLDDGNEICFESRTMTLRVDGENTPANLIKQFVSSSQPLLSLPSMQLALVHPSDNSAISI